MAGNPAPCSTPCAVQGAGFCLRSWGVAWPGVLLSAVMAAVFGRYSAEGWKSMAKFSETAAESSETAANFSETAAKSMQGSDTTIIFFAKSPTHLYTITKKSLYTLAISGVGWRVGWPEACRIILHRATFSLQNVCDATAHFYRMMHHFAKFCREALNL